jgi:hypothetical protein
MNPIELIKACGFRVFMRNPSDKYCQYTDGTRIAHCQWRDHYPSVSTEHVPNRQVGTGYHFADEITVETIPGAINCHAREWACRADRAATVKWSCWDSFHKSSKFNQELKEV